MDILGKNVKNTPINQLKLWLGILLLLLNSLVFANQRVVFAIDIIRHGDRMPTVEVPKDPYNWPEKLGELSALGMQQEFNLGKKFHNIYINQYGLLPKNYNSSNLYVRSSDLNRTLMSAQSVLFALYPLGTGPLLSKQKPALPMRYQPIPVHTIAASQDNVLIPGHNQPEFKSLVVKYVISSAKWQEKTKQYQDKLQRWSNVTGLSIKDLTQVIPLGDNLYIRTLYGVAMPKGISNKDRDELITLTNWVASSVYAPYEIGAYTSKILRLDIANYLESAAATPNPELKYVLFSAHDTTLMGMMSAFGQPLQRFPPYSSDLKILLTRDESDKNYYVQLQFNEKDIALKGCEKPCNLTTFIKFLK